MPRTPIALTAALACFLQTLPSSADPTLECSGGSQVEIGACVAEMEEAVAQALATALEIAQSSAAELDEATGRTVAAPALQDAQAAWTAYRDAQCDYIGATYGGGSGTGIAITACRITLGRHRVTALLGSAP